MIYEEPSKRVSLLRMEKQLKSLLTMVNNLNLQMSEYYVIGISPQEIQEALQAVQDMRQARQQPQM